MATKRLYRSRRNAKVFGVCGGISEWRDMDVDAVRVVAAILIIASGIFPGLIIYALIGLLVPVEPANGFYRDEKYRPTKDDLRNMFDSLKRRVQGMEDEVFDKERDWDQRFYNDKNK